METIFPKYWPIQSASLAKLARTEALCSKLSENKKQNIEGVGWGGVLNVVRYSKYK
jgi:hypothetical protein